MFLFLIQKMALELNDYKETTELVIESTQETVVERKTGHVEPEIEDVTDIQATDHTVKEGERAVTTPAEGNGIESPKPEEGEIQ